MPLSSPKVSARSGRLGKYRTGWQAKLSNPPHTCLFYRVLFPATIRALDLLQCRAYERTALHTRSSPRTYASELAEQTTGLGYDLGCVVCQSDRWTVYRRLGLCTIQRPQSPLEAV